MADELVDRMAILVAFRRIPCMGVANSRSSRSESYARMQHLVRRSTCTYVPLRRFFGGVYVREFMQRPSASLHVTLGSYLRDALEEDSVDAMAYLPSPRA
jgi:hypothetical protein